MPGTGLRLSRSLPLACLAGAWEAVGAGVSGCRTLRCLSGKSLEERGGGRGRGRKDRGRGGGGGGGEGGRGKAEGEGEEEARHGVNLLCAAVCVFELHGIPCRTPPITGLLLWSFGNS